MKKCLLIALLSTPICLLAQDNYEIQVYGAPTQAKGETMVELHSNFTIDGEKQVKDGVRPSYHALHETLEITQGVTDIFEIGFYLFTNYTSPYGYRVIGTHIRPRICAPDSWKLPVGLSLSTEFGYQRSEYSEDTWNIEIRPIIDRQWDKLYVSFNPTFGITLKSAAPSHAPTFEPNLKVAYAINPKLSLGAEYYGDMGPVDNFESAPDQSHALFAVADLYLDPRWEINMGAGWGLTPATDRLIAKLIVGRRLSWHKHHGG